MRALLRLPIILSAFTLLFFMARRWLFLFASLPADRPRQPAPSQSHLPSVLLLVPFHNEKAALPDLLRHLEHLDHPAQTTTIVLIDDHSTDGSPQLAKTWAAQHQRRHLLSLPQQVGKASALNAALKAFPGSELVAVYDADERPHPDALSHMVNAFRDKHVGAVSGRRAITNAIASPIASYTTFESLVHQLVTMRAKQTLNLAPALLGSNCVYRRQALEQVGRFPPGALLEDSHITLKLIRSGWHTHFLPQAISHHAVPTTIRGYWRQHSRWASGFQDVAQRQARSTVSDATLPLPLRLELLAFSAGYLDRLAWLVTIVTILTRARISRPPPPFLKPIVAASLLTPLLQVAAALSHDRAPAALWRRILWLPIFLLLDILTAAIGILQRLARHSSQKPPP